MKQNGVVRKPGPVLLFFIFWFEYLISGPKSYRDVRETGPRLRSGGKKAKTGWSVMVPIGCLSQDCNAKKIVTFHTRLQLSQYDHTPKLYIGEFNTFHPSLSLLYLECAFIRVAAVCLLARPLSRILYTSSLSWTTSSSSPCMTTEP